MPATPTATLTVTRYTACAVPLDHPDAYQLTVDVEWRAPDRWAVCTEGMVLTTTGAWAMDRMNDASPEAWEAWLDLSTFDLETAQAHAVRLAAYYAEGLA